MTAKAGRTPGSTASRRATPVVEDLEREGLLEKVEDHQHAVGAVPALRHRDRAADLHAVVREDRRRWPKQAIRVVEEGQSASCRRTGRRPTSTGWTTSTTGASRASSGGATASRRGTAACGEDGRCRAGARAVPECGGANSSRTPTCSTPGSPRSSGRSRRSAGRSKTEDFRPLLSDRRCWSPAFDIIFFWVARMIMMGLEVHRRRAVPRRLHPRARARRTRARRCASRRGTCVDPLEVMDEYGADALRFTLTAMAAPGRTSRSPKGGSGLPAVQQQDLERVAVRADEPRRRREPRRGAAQPRRCRSSTAGFSLA